MYELHTKLYVRLQKLVNFYILKKKIKFNETSMKSQARVYVVSLVTKVLMILLIIVENIVTLLCTSTIKRYIMSAKLYHKANLIIQSDIKIVLEHKT